MNLSSNLTELVPFLNGLADTARNVTMRYFRGHVDVEQKADNSPVTIADRDTEKALRQTIHARFPDHGLYGEEYGRDDTLRRYSWVIDPIDGTKSFISGIPTFGTLIALLEDEIPVLGAIEIPALKERWIGGRGVATTYNNELCHTGGCEQLAQAGLFATSIDMFLGTDRDRFEALSSQVRMRRFGGDCYAYGLLALGFVDLIAEADMAPYDFLAMAPVVEKAGGVISDWRGQALSLSSDGTVLAAATSSLHAQALAVLGDR